MELSAFLLPATLATFSLAFGILWWYGSKPAFWWMIAYSAQCVAYLGEIVPTALHHTIDTMVVDTIFVIGFLGFGQAICIFFGWPRRIVSNLCLATAICAFDAWQIFVANSLKGELLAVDLGLGALALAPLLFNLRKIPVLAMDRAMVAVAVLAILNCVVISSMFAVFGDANASFDTYMDSSYIAASYAVSSFLNLVVPLVQLAAVALRAIADHRTASEVDLLTGLLNRRGFDRACSQAGRWQRGCVVTCDIDRFKNVNDGFGHAVGDTVIVKLAAAIRSPLPEHGLAARFGGDEFVVFLPGVDIDDAVSYAKSVLCDFTAGVANSLQIPFSVTSSFGISLTSDARSTMHDDLKRADRALYTAKQAGRNRVSTDLDKHGSLSAARDQAKGPVLRLVA